MWRLMTQTSSRRRFLEVLARGGALAGVACVGVACGGAAQPTGMIAASNVSDLSVGSLNVVPGVALAIGRDAGGVYAMTLICTHESCDMATDGSVTAQIVRCNCHGSEFDGNGAVLVGPAQTPLEHFAVTISSTGEITVDADQTVSAGTRTAAA
jgi:Rieske Fe-S protein